MSEEVNYIFLAYKEHIYISKPGILGAFRSQQSAEKKAAEGLFQYIIEIQENILSLKNELNQTKELFNKGDYVGMLRYWSDTGAKKYYGFSFGIAITILEE